MNLEEPLPDPELRCALPLALSATLLILTAWGFSDREIEQVLDISNEQLERYHQNPPTGTEASEELLLRVSHILGIQRILEMLLADWTSICYWMNRFNDAPVFAGCSPKSVIVLGGVARLLETQRYLDDELSANTSHERPRC